jgi:competence protein ComEA
VERKIRWVWWGILAALILAAAWKFFLPHGDKTYIHSGAAETTATAAREIVVYVSGAVEKPGLIHLPLDARMDDAVKSAGPLPEANLETMNLAEKLKDGRKIVVPYQVKPVSEEDLANGITPAVPSGALGAASGGSQALKININTANQGELGQLPGVGPALAQRIIQYREKNGLFVSPEDLQKVSGIGPKTYEKMADMITVGP